QPFLGCEALDITEISGTETLIRESEANAAALFASGRTVYGTGGSSQCVRAMVYLAVTQACGRPRGFGNGRNCAPPAIAGGQPRPVLVAARNAHKSLLYAAALCDAEIVWLWPEGQDGTADSSAKGAAECSLWACPVTAGQVSRTLDQLHRTGRQAAAVYVTSPDYLGGTQDITALSDAAHRHGVPLLVDNAHGAYLRFLAPSCHPLDLGADLCCDSAHKTLPVLTGGAYLHIAKTAPASFQENAGTAMELFGSTSPSWLTLASLDLCNRYLSGDSLANGVQFGTCPPGSGPGYPARLAETADRLDALRDRLREAGWVVRPGDPLRITLQGDGFAMRDRLRRGGVEWEYADQDFLVLMATPENPVGDLDRIAAALGRRDVPAPPPPSLPPVRGEAVLTPREAVFAPRETIPVEAAVGRICGAPTVSCPPAVPIAVSGERIGREAVEVFRYYGIQSVDVVPG
ncbi:MAG: PLP-dependent transferase, partial [Oscillibacter sp.]|nr:PLP-dependent transferase [Oscillibacter sp.]